MSPGNKLVVYIAVLAVLRSAQASDNLLKDDAGADKTRRMVLNLSSGMKFEAHEVNIAGVEGYVCACSVGDLKKSVQDCQKRLGFNLNCIEI